MDLDSLSLPVRVFYPLLIRLISLALFQGSDTQLNTIAPRTESCVIQGLPGEPPISAPGER